MWRMSDATPLTDDTPQAATLSDEVIGAIATSLREGEENSVATPLEDLSTADTAELIAKLGNEEREIFLSHFAPDIHPECYTLLDADLRRQVLERYAPAQVASIIADLDSDDAVEVIDNLDPIFQKEVIRKLSAKNRATIEEGLTFADDTAGRLMQREFVAIPQFWTVGKTIDYLRAAADDLPEDFFDIIIIDPQYHVCGELPLNRLVRAKRSVRITDLALDETHTIPFDMDQEDVARIFRRDVLSSAPVVDGSGRLIGVITLDDIVDVIVEEAAEDILRLGGVETSDIYRAVLQTTRSRFAWLFVNLLTAIAASAVISLFDATIEQIVALAILMPIVASMGGNAGTQTLTVAVRALATNELSAANMGRMIGKETVVGLLNGLAFAVIAGGLTWAWFSDPLLGGVIAAAMVVNLLVAGLSGIGIPIILHRLGLDPALASSVFLTTVTDVVGFFAFLGLAAIVLL